MIIDQYSHFLNERMSFLLQDIFSLMFIELATHHDSLSVFSSVMLWFVVPITVIILLIIVFQQLTGRVINKDAGTTNN